MSWEISVPYSLPYSEDMGSICVPCTARMVTQNKQWGIPDTTMSPLCDSGVFACLLPAGAHSLLEYKSSLIAVHWEQSSSNRTACVIGKDSLFELGEVMVFIEQQKCGNEALPEFVSSWAWCNLYHIHNIVFHEYSRVLYTWLRKILWIFKNIVHVTQKHFFYISRTDQQYYK